MPVIQFVSRMDNQSSEKGYQWKFYCDTCGNGYLSSFQTNMIGAAGGVLRAASNFMGGWASKAGSSTNDLQRALGGTAMDHALQNAVQEGKTHFHQCTRCAKWVCPEVCWNAQANMCNVCAPKPAEQMWGAQPPAPAAPSYDPMFDSPRRTDYHSGNLDMGAPTSPMAPGPNAWGTPRPAGPVCGNCGADMGSAKFCPECGSAARAAAKPSCTRCGTVINSPTKFCPECGNRL